MPPCKSGRRLPGVWEVVGDLCDPEGFRVWLLPTLFLRKGATNNVASSARAGCGSVVEQQSD
eukprot:6415857-Prorocentrum_lima.AAC.1